MNFNRRNLMATATAAVASATSGALMAQTTTARPRTFVLVHGAWHGGWCWSRVAQRLRTAGHIVHAPTLTGLGERRHLISTLVNLDTHVADVVNLMEAEELNDVVLVGHSYAGIIISGVADVAATRLRHLVYLDSLLLENGRSIFSTFPPAVVEQRMKTIRETGAGVGAVAAFPPSAFGVKDPADAEWVARRLTPQPVGTYLQPLLLKAPLGNGVSKTYIDCTLDPMANLAAGKTAVRADSSWAMRSLPTGHDAMITAPGPLSDMLISIAT